MGLSLISVILVFLTLFQKSRLILLVPHPVAPSSSLALSSSLSF